MEILQRLQEKDLTLYRGDSKVFKVEVPTEDGELFDLTGYEFNAQIRRTHNSVDVLAEFEILEDEFDAGIVTVVLHSYQTQELEDAMQNLKSVVWDLQATSPHATPIVTTTHYGAVTFLRDVTRVNS